MDKISWIADSIRVALFDNIKVYHYHKGNDWRFILQKGNQFIAGAELVPEEFLPEDWWLVNSLWSDSAPATMALLYAMLKTAKRIVPSTVISPAASAVVARFYKQYRDTPVVEEDTFDNKQYPPWIRAGYVWSDEIRGVDVPIEEVTDPARMSELTTHHGNGFAEAYDDKNRTKSRDPTYLLKAKDKLKLDKVIQDMMKHSTQRFQVLPWIKKHQAQLAKEGLLDTVQKTVEDAARAEKISLEWLAEMSGLG
jgi:hypothetical protein